jgi:hypothetical protein
MNILRPLPKEELNNFFSEHSLKVIQYFMNTSLFAQPEVYKDKESLPILGLSDVFKKIDNFAQRNEIFSS